MNPDDLLLQFQAITTNDHESLISQFSKVLQIEPSIATFFLESSNWNVETAVNTYLSNFTSKSDMEAMMVMQQQQPNAEFISDLSDMQQVKFTPGQLIPMIWSFRNNGTTNWPMDVHLVFADGHKFEGGVDPATQQSFQNLSPAAEANVQVQLIAPSGPGTYAGNWRLANSGGYFGDPIWVIVNVDGESSMEMC